MLFDDWKDKQNNTINPALLWEYNINTFDWQKGRPIVVQRVIERGRPEDWYAAINLYGGLDNFIDIIKNEVPVLNEINMNFVCKIFDLKEEELKCYKHRQRREELLNS